MPVATDEPIVLRLEDPNAIDAADVVYLHGRDSSEREAARFVRAFPQASLRAYRGPIVQGGGFAWFLNTGIGVAEPTSLASGIACTQDWINADSGLRRPWLCGFSNGAAMAASLALQDPDAYAGLVMIAGCFAIDTLPPDRLRGLPVLMCRGKFDNVIPREKFAQADEYLEGPSGANVASIIYNGGHDVTVQLLAEIADWFGQQERRVMRSR